MTDRSVSMLPSISDSIDNIVKRVRRLETLETPNAGGWPILTVAASDASAQAKADADYICDGVDDQVEIQLALDANHAAGANVNESTVYLTEGTFYISAAIKMYSYSTLWGSGGYTRLIPQVSAYATDFYFIENANLVSPEYNISIRDLRIDCNYSSTGKIRGIHLKEVWWATISHCWFWDIPFAAILMETTCLNNHIIDCEFDFCSWTMDDPLYEATIETGLDDEGLLIANNTFYYCNNCSLRCKAIDATIVNNLFMNGGEADVEANFGGNISIWNDSVVIVGNYIRDGAGGNIVADGSLGPGGHADMAGVGTLVEIVIVGNVLNYVNAGHNIRLKSITNSNVSGNTIGEAQHHGISLEAVNDSVINSNTLWKNGLAIDAEIQTYDNINVDGDSNYNCIQGNLCRCINTATSKTRYGINIANANCDGNMVTNNDLYNAGVTGNFNDTGTGTITAAGNRV